MDNVGAFAAQAAFFILLSAIPFLIFFSSLLPYTPVSRAYVIETAAASMPDYVEPFFIHVLDEVYDRRPGVLSVTAFLAVWAAGKAIQYLTAGLNAVNGMYETRSWLVIRFWSVIYTLVFVLALLTVLTFFIFSDALYRMLPENGGIFSFIVRVQPLFRGIIIFCLLCVFFTILFAALPNRKLTFLRQFPGGVACALSWYVFSFLLSVYVNDFQGFSMYGSMTTVALLMLWLYVCMYIFLVCAEANLFFGELTGRILFWRRSSVKKENCRENSSRNRAKSTGKRGESA